MEAARDDRRGLDEPGSELLGRRNDDAGVVIRVEAVPDLDALLGLAAGLKQRRERRTRPGGRRAPRGRRDQARLPQLVAHLAQAAGSEEHVEHVRERVTWANSASGL